MSSVTGDVGMKDSVREVADQAHAAYAAARGRLLAAVAELATSEAWCGDAAGNLASWLSARWQIELSTARQLVRDAQAVAARTVLGEALQAGTISVDQCSMLTVLCEPHSDDAAVALESLPYWSVSELRREVRVKRARQAERRDGGVYFRLEHTRDERYMRGEFQLTPEDGALVLRAVDSRIPRGTRFDQWDQASASALVEMSTDSLNKSTAGGRVHRATVVVSVDQDALAKMPGAETVGRLNTGGYVDIETARRLVCDGRIQLLVKDADGRIVDIGSTSQTVPLWLRRAVEERDGGVCTFPGCGRTRYLECHHIIFRSDRGPTVLWNLQLTCLRHHKLLHEGGWSLTGEAGPNAIWLRPDGTPFEPRIRVTLDTS